MRPLEEFTAEARSRVRFLLTDIDDTLTDDGSLGATAYSAMERLQAAGIHVIPVTGRAAGWCDHIARMWPVSGVVGENGALYFHYRRDQRKLVQRFWRSESQRAEDRQRLAALGQRILEAVPGCALASDQPYRLSDLAIDFCEDVAALDDAAVARIVELFTAAGCHAKISSIHVNGWYGDFDKLAMTRRLLGEIFDLDLDRHGEAFVFSGDSPNDAPMFEFFANAVGVANVRRFESQLSAKPTWITNGPGGVGFAELAEALLAARPATS